MASMRDMARERRLKDLLRRDHTLFGGSVHGLDGYTIELQARAMEILRSPRSWREVVGITGMARGAIAESLDRISGAFAKFEIENPEVAITVNLAPADLPKEGTWLDLPIAIILLQAAGILPDLLEQSEGNFILMGELGLHGEIRRVPGALSMAFIAKPGQTLVVPRGNERECALILAKPGHEGCKICAVSTLDEVVEYFRGKKKLENALKDGVKFDEFVPKAVDFGRIKGQEKGKQGALIAAAGGHNLLLIGPPGEGKSLLASAIPGILPRLSDAEVVELTRIYSAAGELESDGLVVSRRPFRSVHHSASKQALVGGGSGIPKPGEVTKAHLGILFLDELAEFSKSTLDSLRQPVEDGCVHLSRVRGALTFPCQFSLVAAMNPCPCGYFGTERCRCSENEVKKYQGKISGPILDRIDLQIELTPLTTEERFAASQDNQTPKLRRTVQAARDRQARRFEGTAISCNARIPGGHILDYCNFSSTGLDEYKRIVDNEILTTRSTDRLAKVSRTIADLEESDEIYPDHVNQASGYVVGGMLRSAL